jgi:hypothetical protein
MLQYTALCRARWKNRLFFYLFSECLYKVWDSSLLYLFFMKALVYASDDLLCNTPRIGIGGKDRFERRYGVNLRCL